MTAVMTALNLARDMEWLQSVPKIRKPKVSKLRHMKGRAICGEELDKVLAKINEVVGHEAAPSWTYLVRGLWESSLRLDELMHLHWSDERFIVPRWSKGKLRCSRFQHQCKRMTPKSRFHCFPLWSHYFMKHPKNNVLDGYLNHLVCKKKRSADPEPSASAPNGSAELLVVSARKRE